MRTIAASIARVACDSDTPAGRLNDIVEATNCPWWLTPSGEIVGLKRVLVGCIARPSADADVLHRVQEQVGARLLGELDAQPRDDLVGRLLPLGQRLERDEHHAGIARLTAGERHYVVDRGI